MKEDLEKKEDDDFKEIMNNLKKVKEEGNDLYRKKQIEEAKNIFINGYNCYKKISSLNSKLISMDQYNDIISLYIKILSNLALCYYKQGNYEQSIKYDLQLISLDPEFAKSLVRLFYAYSRINKSQQAVYYGNIFLGFDKEKKIKFKGIENKIREEKDKLKKIQKSEEKMIYLIKFVPLLILILAIVIRYILKK